MKVVFIPIYFVGKIGTPTGYFVFSGETSSCNLTLKRFGGIGLKKFEAGYEKVFTISRNFRNEGIDRWHTPEFAEMELYQAYADYNDMMKIVEDLFLELSQGKEMEYQATLRRLAKKNK